MFQIYSSRIAVALLALTLAISTALGQTTVSASGSNDAAGSSIAVFTSTEMVPRTIIRIAYVDGISSGAPGTAIHIADYTSAMSAIGERTITISAENAAFTRPLLSRDGRGVTFFAPVDDEEFPTTPYFAALASTPYSSTGTVSANAAPYAGMDNASLAQSDSSNLGYDQRPPAISNLNDGTFFIVWEDRHRGDLGDFESPYPFGYHPLMVWDTNSNTVSDATDTHEWSEPAISGDGEYLAYNDGQIRRSHSVSQDWENGTIDTVSRYSSNDGNAPSRHPQIDGSGDYVVFATDATNLRASDTNGMSDIYVWSGGTVTLVYNDPGFSFTGETCANPTISPDGSWIGFESNNTEFLSGSVDYGALGGPFAYRVERGSPGTLALMSRTSGSPIPARDGALPAVANAGHYVFQTSGTGVASGDTRSGLDIIYRAN